MRKLQNYRRLLLGLTVAISAEPSYADKGGNGKPGRFVQVCQPTNRP